MTEEMKQLVAVQKDISLATGESLGMFTRKVSDAGTKYVKQKLNATNTKDASSSCYPIEIFSKSIIFSFYQYGPNVDDSARSRYYAVGYSRNKDGTFEFSTLTEVEQVVGYQPKNSTTVTKAKSAMPGWQSVTKSLWDGVL